MLHDHERDAVSIGPRLQQLLHASRPPAEAPIATMGKFARPLTERRARIRRDRSGVEGRGRLPDLIVFLEALVSAEETLKALPHRLYDSDHLGSTRWTRAVVVPTSIRE
jgi:hypothetical protein